LEVKKGNVAKNEKCKISDEKIEAIAMRSEGSLRKAINELQKLS
jgi:DNA polymerase III delta prime subunit